MLLSYPVPRPAVRGFLFIDFLWICDIFKVIKGTHRGGLSPFSSLKKLTQSFRPVGKLYFFYRFNIYLKRFSVHTIKLSKAITNIAIS